MTLQRTRPVQEHQSPNGGGSVVVYLVIINFTGPGKAGPSTDYHVVVGDNDYALLERAVYALASAGRDPRHEPVRSLVRMSRLRLDVDSRQLQRLGYFWWASPSLQFPLNPSDGACIYAVPDGLIKKLGSVVPVQ